MSQLSIFDILVGPKIRFENWDESGEPHPEKLDIHLFLKNPRKGWRGCNLADIEVHKFKRGWAWSVCYNFNHQGSGYACSGKQRVFAHSAEDAVHYAKIELEGKMDGRFDKVDMKPRAAVLDWLKTI